MRCQYSVMKCQEECSSNLLLVKSTNISYFVFGLKVMPVELCFLDEERMELQLKKGICIQLIGG